MERLISSGAGHGGVKTSGKWRDSGAVGNGRLEADVARLINSKLIALTGAKDTTDNAGTTVNDNLYRIARNINSHEDGIALSHHLNAFNSKATGVEVLYGSNAQKPLAMKLSAAIAKALGVVDRGAKDGSWLAIAQNTGTNKKVLLIEWCFIDNPNDMAKLDKNMDKAVQAVAEIFGYKSTANKPTAKPAQPKPQLKSIDTIAKEVIAGKWGSGQDRFNRLTKAGYNAQEVQKRVNTILGAKPVSQKPMLKPLDTVAREVISGSWGSGQDRFNRLAKAGYNAQQVQNRVNELLGAGKPKLRPIDTVAREVINGVWGNGNDRKQRLERAGYNYNQVQSRVNQLL
ncbi:N-acetylmuramoyl-L-alanine amidase [Vagococcus lutrae]|uniref:N-acetylmuramoyl-L-alanine amidase n=1 Tax=Vagococcus lutrae TaxID=81947 RepID=UPI002891E1BD|nr:N-acetylmuramoyl-L-alanine amidase [Vagococcus lutrae]MDT2818652.1 N-acetylmuramoyl-L-alanine amidase [Vagococcus lutrae]MDT2843780.1 N-acetylmuramoyl-L-alanine amidase [Vagococcus lutrae]